MAATLIMKVLTGPVVPATEGANCSYCRPIRQSVFRSLFRLSPRPAALAAGICLRIQTIYDFRVWRNRPGADVGRGLARGQREGLGSRPSAPFGEMTNP